MATEQQQLDDLVHEPWAGWPDRQRRSPRQFLAWTLLRFCELDVVTITMLLGMAFLVGFALVASVTPAGAQEWPPRRACEWTDTCPRYQHRHHARERYRYYRPGPRVRSWVQREEDEHRHGCRDVRRVVGDQHLTVDGAKKAANDAWAGTVRFHLGEKFMDLLNARRIVYTCSRSSIKEGGVTTLGQSLTRCEVEAQPCSAERKSGEE